MTKGTIYKIEKYAPNDGPGIRTVIFLKGCPLHCQWCSSPESQRAQPEMIYMKRDCTICGRCIPACPNEAISIREGVTITDRERCVNCGACAQVCLNHARRMVGYEVTVDEVMKEIEKDSIFYFNSGGGVTLSGGEITMQPQFVREVLQRSLELGIHTAIETCAYCKWEALKPIVECVGRLYVDIKCVDPEKHRALTGVDNAQILENIRRMSEYEDIELVPRMPTIPGYNDMPEDMRNLAEFVKSLKHVFRVELLPYHRYGIHMYEAIDRMYPLADLESPSDEYMQGLKAQIEGNGFDVQIGG